MCHSLINTSLYWMDQMSGQNAGSCPTIVLKFEYAWARRRGVMFLLAIIDDGSIRPFRIENGVTIDSQGYYAFPNKHFLP